MEKKIACIRSGRAGAFTLVEVLLSMTILSAMMLLMFGVLGATQRVYTDSQSKVEQFREARVAFEAVTRRLSQATLNTYWDYNDPDKPTRYVRQSELHFVSGPAETLLSETSLTPKLTHAIFFQAPLGVADGPAYQPMATALNAWGYFLTCDTDTALDTRPAFIGSRVAARKRSRLMEFRQPTERFSVYTPPGNAPAGFRGLTNAAFKDTTAWFNNSALLRDTTASPAITLSRPIADNIVAFIVSPRSPVPPKSTAHDYDVAPEFFYDSRRFLTASGHALAESTRHQLPPTVQITMVAIDERSAIRYENPGRSTGDLVSPTWFQKAENLDADLQSMTETLISHRLNYQVFSTAVSIRAAKWSSSVQ